VINAYVSYGHPKVQKKTSRVVRQATGMRRASMWHALGAWQSHACRPAAHEADRARSPETSSAAVEYAPGEYVAMRSKGIDVFPFVAMCDDEEVSGMGGITSVH
jgi:hypothetical protein